MFICLIIGSVLLAVFAVLFLMSNAEDQAKICRCICAGEEERIKTSKVEMALIYERIKRLSSNPAMRREPDPKDIKRGKKLKKDIDKAQARYEMYKQKGVGILDLPPLAGYRVMDLMKMDSNTDFIAKLQTKCMQFKEKREAIEYADYLTASLIGNCLLGVCLLFIGTGIGFALGLGTRALLVGFVLFVAFALIGYIPYDGVNVIVKKRDEAIEHDFPRVVSKLALLTVSGIETMRAWNLTAQSDSGTLYVEMQRVNLDLAHNVTHLEAFTKFIKRCNNPYTTKLATALMQNYTKGNSEIVKVLRDLNSESWSEYKHVARRKGEMISNKLFIPTMLLFAGILVLIIVPVVGGFNL